LGWAILSFQIRPQIAKICLVIARAMDALAGNEAAAYTAAAVLGATAFMMLLNKILATNPQMPAVARPYGAVADGVLWNATTPGKFAGPEEVGGATTVHALMVHAFRQFSSEPIAGKRSLLKRHYEEIRPGMTVEKLTFSDEYVFTTYTQYKEQMSALASGMVEFAKLAPGDKIVIYAETQLEWMLAALAAFEQSLTVVTVYATLGEEGLAHGVAQTKAKLIIADAKLLPKVASAVTGASKAMASCKHVVFIGDPVQEHDPKAAAGLTNHLSDIKGAPRCTAEREAGIVLPPWFLLEPAARRRVSPTLTSRSPPAAVGWTSQELNATLALGRSKPRAPVPPKAEDVAVIMYTSGTTGEAPRLRPPPLSISIYTTIYLSMYI